MTIPDSQFDPFKIGGALAVLAFELHDELMSAEPAEAVLRLRSELAKVVLEARQWAERYGVPSACIPDSPGESASAQECLAALHGLAAALSYVGCQAESFDSMRELVAWLRRHGAGALRELEELGCAIREHAHALTELEIAARTLSTDLQSIGLNRNRSEFVTTAMQARAGEVYDIAQAVLNAAIRLHDGVLTWGLADSASGAQRTLKG